MTTWRQINDALSADGEHRAEHCRITLRDARVECRCGVTFGHSDAHKACSAWFEHRAVRTAFPESQAVSRG